MMLLWSRYRPAVLLLVAGAAGITAIALIGRSGDGPPADGVVPDFAFADGEGNPVRLSVFRGRTILLNVWATWCLPCREEMPMLDQLQAELAAPGFEVVAMSIDRSGVPAIQRFYEEYAISNLAIYFDAVGLIDPDGRELFRDHRWHRRGR